MKKLLWISILFLALAQCSKTKHKKNDALDIGEKTVAAKEEKKQITKPGSSFQNIFIITESCAVFYRPDSMQKQKIKAITEARIFESSMHDFFYLQNYAGRYLKEQWPKLKIINKKNVRYLAFIKKDHSPEIIDLNKLNDPYGLIVFNGVKPPMQIDMANVETQVPDYFEKVFEKSKINSEK